MLCREGVSESCEVLEPSSPRPIAVEDFGIELPGNQQLKLDVDRPTRRLEHTVGSCQNERRAETCFFLV